MSSEPHRHSVTAIVVAHDGSRWLPDTLAALRAQTRAPEHVIAVDNDSRDRSDALLAEELGADRVLKLPRDTGFGAAVTKALQHPAAGSSTTVLQIVGGGGSEWVWLLHDDCAPEPEALERLLAAADENRYAAVLGPKLRDWLDRRVLLEAGITIDGSGRRETGLESREFDQGQHDGVHEVLAVSTAGMLVRRDVWDALGGLAPELPLFRDDVDFGWRVNASGHRVLAVTAAVAYHAEAASRRRRRLTAVAEHPRRLDRRNALFVLFANLPSKLAAWALVRNLFGSFLRSLVFLLAKQPGNSWDELAAYGSIAAHPGRMLGARRRRSGGPKRSYRTLSKLMPPRWQGFRRLADMVAGSLSFQGPVEAGRHHAAAGTDDSDLLSEEEDPLATDEGVLAGMLRKPGVLLFLGLAVIALVAARGLLAGGRLGGGALLPVSGGAGDLWQQYLSGWHSVGLGNSAPAPPYVAVIALLATLLLGKTWLAIDIILLGSVPLAGATAYLASGQVVGDVRIRLWAAATYALLPVATGAVAAGRFGTAMAFVLLPVLGLLAARMLGERGRAATRAAWGVGLVLAVMTAFVPLTWLLAVVLGLAVHRNWGSSVPRLGRRLAIALLAPPVLLMPWTTRVVLHPGLFLREAGLSTPDLLTAPGPASLLALHPGGPGLPPGWVTAGLLAVGLVALARRDRRSVIGAGWALAIAGMVSAVAVSRIAVAPPSESWAHPGWPGLSMALASAGVIMAAAVGGERVLAWAGERPRRPMIPTADSSRAASRSGRPVRGPRAWLLAIRRAGVRLAQLRVFRWQPWAAGGLTLLACSTPVAAAGVWVYTGVSGPVDRSNPRVLPAFVAASNSSPSHPRALVLRSTGDEEVSYAILRGQPPVLGSSEIPTPPGVTDHVAGVVAGLAAGRRSGEVQDLSRRGIQFVVMPGPLNEELLRTLDANPKLTRASMLPNLAVWRLEAPASRLGIVAGEETQPLPSGRVNASVQVPKAAEPRVAMLAESADPGWHATLEGEDLPPRTVRGWAQGFALPPSGGHLVIDYTSLRGLWVALQALLVFAVLILALPGGGQQQEEEAEPVPRRERKRARKAPRRARGHRAIPKSAPTGAATAASESSRAETRGRRRRGR